MRIVVIVLIVLNILLFAFGMYSEYLQDRFLPSSVRTENSLKPAEPPLEAVPLITETSGEENKDPVEPTPDQDRESLKDTADPTPALADVPVITNNPPLQDKPQPSASKEPAKPKESSAKPGPAPATLACFEIGPIAGERIPAFKQRIHQLYGNIRLEIEQRARPVGPYWVHLPSVSTREEGQQQIKAIEEKNIYGSFLVQDPANPNKWMVSLGLFNSEERAKTYQKTLSDKGIQASLGNRTSDVINHFVQLFGVPESIQKQKALLQKEFSNLTTYKVCQPS